MPGIALWKHIAAVLYENAASNHLGGMKDAGVGDRPPERRPQRDDGSNVRRPLGRNRTGDDAS